MITALHCRLLGLVVDRPTPDAVTEVIVESAASAWSSLLLGLPWSAAGGPVLGQR